jgi:hypothetical protein
MGWNALTVRPSEPDCDGIRAAHRTRPAAGPGSGGDAELLAGLHLPRTGVFRRAGFGAGSRTMHPIVPSSSVSVHTKPSSPRAIDPGIANSSPAVRTSIYGSSTVRR